MHLQLALKRKRPASKKYHIKYCHRSLLEAIANEHLMQEKLFK